MRRLLLVGVLLLVSLSWACKDGNSQVSGGSDNPAKVSTNQVAKRPTRARYSRPSSEQNFILVTVKNSASAEQSVIVIDNTDWISMASQIGFAAEPHEQYVEFMLGHENTPFEVDPATYAKLAKYAAPEPSAEMRSMSMSQLMDRYFSEFERDYILKDREMMRDASFLRLLLEKQAIVKVGCESGELTVSY